MSRIRISPDGDFKVGGKSYRIPDQFTPRAISNYLELLRPIPDIRGGTKLSVERRAATEAYLSRRAATGMIPGFRMSEAESLSMREMRVIHRWIARNREVPSTGVSGRAG